jgi:hypothetical protein
MQPDLPPQHTGHTSHLRPRSSTERGPQLSGSLVRQSRRGNLLVLLVLVALAMSSCVHRHWQNPLDEIQVLSAGTWGSSPLWNGPGQAPPGYENLVISISELVDRDAALHDPLQVYARGSVSWNGVSWPATFHLGPALDAYCCYAPGHPFRGTADPNGFGFHVLAPRGSPLGPGAFDQLLVDHDSIAQREPGAALEKVWYCYSRGGK